MTLGQLLHKEEDKTLLAMYVEVTTGYVPANSVTREYCRKVNALIDEGKVLTDALSHRRLYVPALARAVLRELADRYALILRDCGLDVPEV